MAKLDEKLFLAKLSEMFPDTVTSGSFTKKQVLQVREAMNTNSWPYELMKNSIGRGLYAISGGADQNINPVVGNTVLKTVKHEESFVVDYSNVKSLIPNKDKNFVPFGNFKDLENIISSGMFYPTYISGPTGNGKSTMVEQICAKLRRPLIRVNLNMMADEEQLIGSKTLVDGNVQIVEGPVLIAMRTGTTLLLDEIDAGAPNTLLCLQPILEGKPYYFKLKNEMIVPAPGFNIIATANTKGKGSDDGRYIGTNVLNEAFLERFAVTFEQQYPLASVETKIVLNLMDHYNCVNKEFANNLVKWANAIRKTFDDGGIDETITTRRLIHIVRAFSIFKNETKALELCCNRFDTITKTAFIELFEKIGLEPDEPDAVDVAEESAEVANEEKEISF